MDIKPIDISCPNCGERARFEEPFEFLSKKSVSADETRPLHSWGSWCVLERFPSIVQWKAPSGPNQYLRTGGDTGGAGYPLLTNGLVQCDHCHTNKKHKLNWPRDAYWQWDIRGEQLWAWDEKHARLILGFIKKTVRPSRVSYDLRYIPSHFLSAKVRDLVVKKMESDLKRL